MSTIDLRALGLVSALLALAACERIPAYDESLGWFSRSEYDAEMAKWSALSGVTMLPPRAIADAVLWLASDAARYVTGVELPVDAGHMILPGHNAKPVLDNSHEG